MDGGVAVVGFGLLGALWRACRRFFRGGPGVGEVASAERSEARLSRWGVAGQVDQVQQLQAEDVLSQLS